MNEKYLYFRKGPALADDDDSANSCCFPLSSLAGMHPSDDDHLTLAFKSLVDLFASNQKDGMLVIGDAVTGDFCNGLITAIDTITIDGINS